MSELADLLVSIFRGRSDVVAVGDGAKGFAPYATPPCAELVSTRHLSGRRCLGFYLMTPASTVYCTCVDFDNKELSPDPMWQSKAERVAEWLEKAGLSPVVEISASGNGAHVWLFCEESPAWVVRSFWATVSEKVGIAFREVYPRQDRLSGKGLGNLVRYPLWGKSRFVDVAESWATADPVTVLGGIRRTSAAELTEVAGRFGFKLKREEEAAKESAIGLSLRVQRRLARKGSLLARRWGGDMAGLRDASRSALLESIACELVRQYVPTDEIAAAIRYWCAEHEYEKGDRPQWVADTVRKAYDYTFSRVEEKSADVSTMRDAALAYIGVIEKGERFHFSAGVDGIDGSIEGVAPGEMAVIAGRPSHGKSALALQWLDHVSRLGVPSLVISEEMSKIEIGKRALLSLSPMPQEHWGPEVANHLRADVERHYGPRAPIHLVENCNTVDRVETVIDQMVALHGVKIVAVDYVQLLSSKADKVYEEVTAISKKLKQTAKRNNVALLAVCQLNREIDKRPDRKPKLSDLKESGQLEQDADLVLVVQWPYRFDRSIPKEDYIVYVLKRRNGQIREPEIKTTFNPDRQTIGAYTTRVPGEEG